MSAGSISGNVSGMLSGNAPGSVTGGTATTKLTGAPTLNGSTGTNASPSSAVPTMPPYLVMNYYIAAINGIYPMRD